MKVRATCSFAGAVSMAKGESRDLPEPIAAPLLKCGYLKEVVPSVKKNPSKAKKEAGHASL